VQSKLATNTLYFALKSGASFQALGGPEFSKLVGDLNPKAVIINSERLKHCMRQLAGNGRKLMRQFLKGAKGLAITTDAGTNNRINKFLAITAHWLDAQWTLFSAVLDVVYMAGRSNEEELKMHLQRVLKDFEIQEKDLIAVSDNASNICAALKVMDLDHVRCGCHTISLIVNDALKKPMSQSEMVRKTQAGVGLIRGSPLYSGLISHLQKIQCTFPISFIFLLFYSPGLTL